MERNYDITAIGARVKYTRLLRNITQEQLAEQAGISTSFMYGIESGKKHLSLKTLARISAALNESMDYLVFGNAELPAHSESHIEVERLLSRYDENTVRKVSDLLGVLLPMLK